jgi:hypothetical protein
VEIGAEYRDFMNGCSECVFVFVIFEFGERVRQVLDSPGVWRGWPSRWRGLRGLGRYSRDSLVVNWELGVQRCL